jgi:hypothetical protein
MKAAWKLRKSTERDNFALWTSLSKLGLGGAATAGEASPAPTNSLVM